MRLDVNQEDLTLLVKGIAKEVVKELTPFLQAKPSIDGDKIFTVETLAQYLGLKKDWVYGNI